MDVDRFSKYVEKTARSGKSYQRGSGGMNQPDLHKFIIGEARAMDDPFESDWKKEQLRRRAEENRVFVAKQTAKVVVKERKPPRFHKTCTCGTQIRGTGEKCYGCSHIVSRPCPGNCGRRLNIDNTRGMCQACYRIGKRRELKGLTKCSHEGCEVMLKRIYTVGLCKVHGGPVWRARYRQRKREERLRMAA